MSHGGPALVILGAVLAAPPIDGSDVRYCEFTASVIEVVKPPSPVESEGRKALSMTLKIKVSKASAKDGSYTDCTEYVGTEIQTGILTDSRQTADAVKKGRVVSLTYSHISGLGPEGEEVAESWWLSAVLGP